MYMQIVSCNCRLYLQSDCLQYVSRIVMISMHLNFNLTYLHT